MAQNEIKIIVTATGAEQAAKVLADVAKSGAQLGSVTVTGAKRAEDALTSLGGTAKRVFEIFTGISLANVTAQIATFAKQSVQELTRMGLENQRVEESFSRMADAVGVHADTMLSSLKRASSGIVDTTSIMLASSKALAQGLNPEQLTRVMETARATATLAGKTVSESYNAIADAVTNLNVKQLREFGIVIDLSKAYETYARSLNTSAAALNEAGQRAALLQAIDEQTRQSRLALTRGEMTNAQEIEKAKAVWSDFFAGIAGGFATTYTASVKWGARFLEQVQIEKDRLDELGVAWNNYLKRKLEAQGGALPQGTGLTMRTSPRELRELADVDAGLGRVGGKATDTASQIDVVKDALLKADEAMQKLALSSARETISAGEFAAAIGAQVAKLQALGSTAPEVTAKIITLQMQMAGLAKAAREAAAALAEIGRKESIAKAFEELKDALFKLDLKDVDDLLKELSLKLGANAVEVKKDADAWREEAAAAELAAEALQQIAPLAKALLQDVGSTGLTEQLIALNRELRALKATTDIDADAIRNFGVSFRLLTDEQKQALLSLREWNAEAAQIKFEDRLAAIGREAQLLGRDYDHLSANLAEYKRRILELQAIKNPTGEVLAEVEQLQAKFADTKNLIQWRDTFQGVFNSVGGAINTLVQGVIMGTQTMGEAFKRLGQSIIINFVNAVIQQALNPLMKAAAGVVAGLFASSPSGRSAAEAAGGVPLAGSTLSPGAFGTGGGFGNIPTGIFDTGTLSNLWTGTQNAWGAFNASLEAGGSVLEGFSGAWDSFMVPFSGAASGLTVGLAGVGAALAVFGTVMDFVNGKTEAAIGGVVGGVTGAVAGGLIGTYLLPGIGTALGALAGGALGDWLGSMLGGLFGGPSNYELKRVKAADEASAYLGGATKGYQSALETRNIAEILKALQSVGTGVNPLRTELVLTSNVAAQLGITGQREGDAIIAQWTDVNEKQMNELIALFKLNPDMVAGAVRGAGDVGYLPQDKAHEFSTQLEQGAEALLGAFTGLGAVTDKINEVARDITDAAKEALPPGLAQEFADGIVNPIRDRMLAVINSGLPVKEMQKQLDTINTELQGKVEAWNMFAVAIKQATVVDALIPADLHAKFRAVMEPAYADMLNTMRNGTAAQAALAADHFAKQTQAWAAFSDAIQAQVGVEMLLAPIADLGDRFSAAMKPVYDKILASLVAGNGAIALAQAQTFAKLTQAWASLGTSVTKGIDVEALLPDNLGDKFRARMQPEYDKILGTLAAGNAEIAAALIAKFDKQLAAWASLGTSVTKGIDVEALLPDNLGDKFRARMQPEYDKILSTLAAGNAEVAAALIAKFDKQLAAWASIGQTVTRITGELAGLTGNLDGSVEAWVAVQAQMDGAVTRAQSAFDKALAGGNVEQIAKTAAALHEATLTRLQAELQMIEMVKKLDAAMLASAARLADLVTTISKLSIATTGSLGPLQTLLGSLEAMARTGATTAQRVWAIEAGLKAVTAVLPGLIERFATFTTAAEFLAAGPQTAGQLGGIPAGITDALLNGAMPFLTALQGLIDTATGEGKLALLQTQVEHFQSLAAAAIAGVNQWAQAAISGARAAAAEALKVARTEAERRIEVARTEADRRQALIDAAREKALAAIDAQIEATEEQAQVAQEARRAEIDALQELIAKSKEWASAVESMGKFIQSLKVGPLGPGNPADKLRQSQDAFAKALQAYNANPTAGGLSDLQGLASTMLGLAEPIFSKPSPQFQALSANTLKQLEAAQALAAAQMTDSKVLQAQLDTLLAMDKMATQAAQEQLDALRKNREAVSKDFDRQTEELSKALEEYVGGVETALKDYEKTVETELDKQVKAIEKAAKDQIDVINIKLIGALNKNAAEQAVLIGEQKNKTDKLIAALTSTEFKDVKLGDIATYAAKRQDVAIGILESIRNGIALAVGTPLAQGSERVTEGLYHLHDDEMVLPKGVADRIRSAEMGAGLPDTTSQAVAGIIANWDNYSEAERAGIISAYNAADDATKLSAERSASYWQASAAQTARAATKPPDLSNTGPWAPGSGDPLRDPWMAHAVQTKAGDWIYEPGYGPGATPGSVVKFGTGPAPTSPGTTSPGTTLPGTPSAPYLPPGPPWLYRGAGSTTLAAGGSMTYGGGAPDGGGPITVVVKLDGKTIAEATLPTIQDSARRGTMRTIILETKAR